MNADDVANFQPLPTATCSGIHLGRWRSLGMTFTTFIRQTCIVTVPKLIDANQSLSNSRPESLIDGPRVHDETSVFQRLWVRRPPSEKVRPTSWKSVHEATPVWARGSQEKLHEEATTSCNHPWHHCDITHNLMHPSRNNSGKKGSRSQWECPTKGNSSSNCSKQVCWHRSHSIPARKVEFFVSFGVLSAPIVSFDGTLPWWQ